jgi:hypothetical protein
MSHLVSESRVSDDNHRRSDGLTTFPVLFPRHLTPQRMPEVISHIQTFRDYFHYHIKASKVRLKRTALLAKNPGLTVSRPTFTHA